MSLLSSARFALLCSIFTASPSLASPVSAPPPYEGVYQPIGVDEIGLWREDDESEMALRNSSIVIRDEVLNTYIKGVLCETVGFDRCGSARIYVIREPTFNATMSPNGTMRIYSGMLLRMRSEAELAAILGHEFGHFEKRHSLNHFKSARSASDLLMWANVLARACFSLMSISMMTN